MEVRISMTKCRYGCEAAKRNVVSLAQQIDEEADLPFLANRGVSSKYAIARNVKTPVNIKKFISLGEAVKVSALYQLATVLVFSLL